MEEFIPDLANLPLALVLGIFGWRILNLLTIVAKAYDTNAKARNTDTGEQATENQRRRDHDDQIALELARHKETEALRQKELAAINLQTMTLQAEIAKTLPVLTATSQQTLTTVEATGPQVEFVHGDLRTLITQLHEITTNALELVNTKQDTASDKQDTQAATMGRIEAELGDSHAAEQAAS